MARRCWETNLWLTKMDHKVEYELPLYNWVGDSRKEVHGQYVSENLVGFVQKIFSFEPR